MPKQRKIHLKRVPDDQLTGSAMPGILSGARAHLVGRTIEEVVYFDLDGEAYPGLVLDDGTCALAVHDDEMNGPGVLLAERQAGGCGLCATQIRRERTRSV